jgi:hypothetical protein
LDDTNFVGGRDDVEFRVDIANAKPPFKVQVELLYQPIGYRWGANVENTPSVESWTFMRAFRAAIPGAYQRLARAERATLP